MDDRLRRTAVPEIRDSHFPIPIQQNVVGFEIAMDETTQMHKSHSKSNSNNHFRDPICTFQWKWLASDPFLANSVTVTDL
jgi:hypothetical protein